MATQFGNTLIIYYSRTGRCEKIARALTELFPQCDVEHLEDERDMTGMAGLAQMSVKALMRKGSDIKPTRYSPEWYDNIYLITPVWAGSIAPAIRTYLHRRKLAKLTLIACSGWTSESGCKDELHREYGICVDHHLRFVVDEVDGDNFRDKLRDFVFPQEERDVLCNAPEKDSTTNSPSGSSFFDKEDAMSKNPEKNSDCCSSKKAQRTNNEQKNTEKSTRDCAANCDRLNTKNGSQADSGTKCCGAKKTATERDCDSRKSTTDSTGTRRKMVAQAKSKTQPVKA